MDSNITSILIAVLENYSNNELALISVLLLVLGYALKKVFSSFIHYYFVSKQSAQDFSDELKKIRGELDKIDKISCSVNDIIANVSSVLETVKSNQNSITDNYKKIIDLKEDIQKIENSIDLVNFKINNKQ